MYVMVSVFIGGGVFVVFVMGVMKASASITLASDRVVFIVPPKR